MTVETTNSYTGPYTTNGSTTEFPFDFDTVSDSDVSVILVDSDGVETEASGFTVSRTDGGGTVTFSTAPSSGFSLFVLLDPDFTQSTDFNNGGTYLASAHNAALNRAALRSIRNKRDIDRAFKVPFGETGFQVPAEADRAGYYLGFNASGAPIAIEGTGDDGTVRPDLASTSTGKGAALVGFKQNGTGAVARTIEAKAREAVSVKDFGAVGDGVTDDSAAVRAAIDAVAAAGGGTVHFPAGRYFSPYTGTYFGDPEILTHANIRLVGAGKPTFASDFSALEGGSVILGSFFFAADGMEFHDLGIDAGADYCTTHNGGTPVEGLVGIDRAEAQTGGYTNTGVSPVPDPSKKGFAAKNIAVLCHLTGANGTVSDVHNVLLENYVGWKIEGIDSVMGGAGIVIKSSHGTLNGAYCRGSNKYSVLNKSQQYADASYNTYSNIVMQNLGVAEPDPLTSADYDTNGFVIEAADADARGIVCSNIIGRGVRNGIQFTSSNTGVAPRDCMVIGGEIRDVDGYAVLFANGDVENCQVIGVNGFNNNRGVSFLSPTADKCAAVNCTMRDTLLYSYRNEEGTGSRIISCSSINPGSGHFRSDAGDCEFLGGFQTSGSAAIFTNSGGTVTGDISQSFGNTPTGQPSVQFGPLGGAMAVDDYTSLDFRIQNNAGGAVSSDGIGAQIRAYQPGTGNTGAIDLMTRASSSVMTRALRLTNDGRNIAAAPASVPTLIDNRTISFYWVDNATLGVAMRGSDGVTRTGTIAVV